MFDLRRFTASRKSGEFSTHLSDPARPHGAFAAWSPSAQLVFGYAWNRDEFPWICRWEENNHRADVPWSGRTLTCAMEFGVSPTVESRRDDGEPGQPVRCSGIPLGAGTVAH